MSWFRQLFILDYFFSMSPILKFIEAARYQILERAKILMLVGLLIRSMNFPDFHLFIKSDIFLIIISPFFVLVWERVLQLCVVSGRFYVGSRMLLRRAFFCSAGCAPEHAIGAAQYMFLICLRSQGFAVGFRVARKHI